MKITKSKFTVGVAGLLLAASIAYAGGVYSNTYFGAVNLATQGLAVWNPGNAGSVVFTNSGPDSNRAIDANDLVTTSDVISSLGPEINLANGVTIWNPSAGLLRFMDGTDAVALLTVDSISTNTATANADKIIRNDKALSSTGTTRTWATNFMEITDVTNASEDAKTVFGVITAGTLANELQLTGANLMPVTDDGLDLGGTSNRWNKTWTNALDADGLITSTYAPTADSASVKSAVSVAATSPVDTTGTNETNGVNVALTIGNASGGTNTVNAFKVGNVTGDAQVSVTGLNIGTGTTLGTSNAINIGTGWDAGISTGSGVYGTGVAPLNGFLAPVNSVTTSSVAITDSGEMFFFSGAGVQSLPEASTAIGMSFTFSLATAANGDINPDDADLFLYAGCSAGDALRADAAGESITVMAVSASQWVVTSVQGTWTDVN